MAATTRKVVIRDENSSVVNVEESSDSDDEKEPARIFHRRISTNKEIKTTVSNRIFTPTSAGDILNLF